ncbi:MAG TPA: hypothetical protein DCM05_08005 [Elusimicrobia bacterium]|nr:hypothetical protein [Elusimicrobiota bacterium]
MRAAPLAPAFDRRFLDGVERFTCVGTGGIGGKASGLLGAHKLLKKSLGPSEFPGLRVEIPTLTVLATGVFDAFMERNALRKIALSDLSDELIAEAFQKASFPAEFIGDLRALIEAVHQPLAVRSSSLLEDALSHPFAGVYATKMIPNNQPDADTRFKRLMEAVKFVYASTFFREAKDYIRATERRIEEEKMAVILQEVVGTRHDERFYPDLSGVARSYGFYRSGGAKPEDGVVNLALGLGKTIVDNGVCWAYCPAAPHAPPPFASASAQLSGTQSRFWAVNMGAPPAYDPSAETEYLVHAGLAEAEYDGTLRWTASTYDPESDRLSPGTGLQGPRALNFAPLLDLEEFPLNALLRRLLALCEEETGQKVEIEFAATFEPGEARFGFLQVRPLALSHGFVDVAPEDLSGEGVLLASESALGNGELKDIRDVVFVKPDRFEAKHTRLIAGEVARMNDALVAEKRPYLLIGFGRWGSSDPGLGVPVGWGALCGAKAIVEATRPDMNVDLSQGSHFFHNISSFGVSYLCVRHDRGYAIDWPWLERQKTEAETEHVRHVRLGAPLRVKVDGRTGRGVIARESP